MENETECGPLEESLVNAGRMSAIDYFIVCFIFDSAPIWGNLFL
jgi:hypothetical protein